MVRKRRPSCSTDSFERPTYEGWTTEVLAATQIEDASDQYRPAGAADSMDVADYIDRNANGIPLDAREEAAIMARGWQ